jgi:hypothetical protein
MGSQFSGSHFARGKAHTLVGLASTGHSTTPVAVALGSESSGGTAKEVFGNRHDTSVTRSAPSGSVSQGSCKRICLHVGAMRPFPMCRSKSGSKEPCALSPRLASNLRVLSQQRRVPSTYGCLEHTRQGRMMTRNRQRRQAHRSRINIVFSHPSPRQAPLLSFPLLFFIPEQLRHSLHHLSSRRPQQ